MKLRWVWREKEVGNGGSQKERVLQYYNGQGIWVDVPTEEK